MPSRESSLRNLEKARACGRPPRPWRCPLETGLIKRFVWQWFIYRGPDKWSGRAMGRWLGVAHTYIQKLLREFSMDATKMQRLHRTFGQATFEQLRRAQELTRKQRERGILRRPCPWKVAKFKVGDQMARAVVRTKASFTVPKAHFAGPQGDPPLANERMGPHYYPTHPPRRRWRPGMRQW